MSYFFATVRPFRRNAFRDLWINRFSSSITSVPSPSRLATAICRSNSAMGFGPIACSSVFRISLNFVLPIITFSPIGPGEFAARRSTASESWPRTTNSAAAFAVSISRSTSALQMIEPKTDAKISSLARDIPAANLPMRGCLAKIWCPRSCAIIASREKSSGSASRSNASAKTVRTSSFSVLPRPYCAPPVSTVNMAVFDDPDELHSLSDEGNPFEPGSRFCR